MRVYIRQRNLFVQLGCYTYSLRKYRPARKPRRVRAHARIGSVEGRRSAPDRLKSYRLGDPMETTTRRDDRP